MRRLIIAIVALTASLSGIAIVGTPAAAAYPSCTTGRKVWDAQFYETVLYETTAWGDPNCEMKPGLMANSAVWNLQEHLNACYGPGARSGGQQLFSPALGIDGNYGPQTTAAVRAVQRHLRLSADGWAGPATRSKMKHPAFGSPQYCVNVAVPIQIAE